MLCLPCFPLLFSGFRKARFQLAAVARPGGQGISEEKNLPEEWSATQNILWKTPIEGRGHSCPIIWGNRLFLTTSLEGPLVPDHKAAKHIGWHGEENYVHPDACGADHRWTMNVLCIDANSGKILWEKTAYEGTVYDDRNRKNTYASGTPVTDGTYVWTFFDAEGLYCYDFSGNLVWKTSLGPIAKGGMGYGMSPVLYEGLIILQCDQELGEGSFIAALDKKTGKEVWRVARNNRRSWATPLLVRSGDHVELIASGAESVIAYEPATGKEIWRCKGTISHPIPSAVTGHDMVFFSAGSQQKHAFAVKLGGKGDLTETPYVVWQYEKGTAYVPSPIMYKDYLYLLTDKGLVTCIEGTTGKIMYEGGRVPVPATFTASPVAYEDKILLCSEDGDVFVLKAGPTHEILHTNSMQEPIYASPAISQGRIFIRGEKNLYCICTGDRPGVPATTNTILPH